MYKNFTIFGYTFHLTLIVEKASNKIIHEATNLLISGKKLNAARLIYDNFNITLTDTKKILDQIVHGELDDNGNYHYVYDINERKKILDYLKMTLNKYGRKSSGDRG